MHHNQYAANFKACGKNWGHPLFKWLCSGVSLNRRKELFYIAVIANTALQHKSGRALLTHPAATSGQTCS